MKKTLITVLVLVAGFFLSSCGGSANGNQSASSGDTSSTNAPAKSDVELLGAGSTFGYPIYSKMFSEYNKMTGVETNYQSIGSGGGIRQLMSKTVDFGATDAYLSDEQLKNAPAPIVHIPTCLGAVVLSYNLPGNPQLKLTPDIVAGIYLGEITKWNDPKIAAVNKDVKLPAMDIMVAHRSDGSGTSFIFTDYLSKVSPEWKAKVGRGTAVAWPTGVGGKGNEGVAGLIKQTPGGFGYVELIYALKNNMGYAKLQNSSGNFIKATLESTSLCANMDMPADARVTITNSDVAQAYPISSFTWIILYKEQHYGNRSKAKATALVKELWWMTHEGQQYCEPLEYAKLPTKAIPVVNNILKSITYDNQPILTGNPM